MKLNPDICHAMTVCFRNNATIGSEFQVGSSVLDQVDCMKILGINIQNNLRWDTQVITMCNAFNRRLYFLRQLKRCGTLEYACPVWHSGLTRRQKELLEKLQKRAFRIILSVDVVGRTSYDYMCDTVQLPPLEERREQLSLKFGQNLLGSTKHRSLLPPIRSNNLRNANTLSIPRCQTNRYKNSAIPFLVHLLNENCL